MRTWYCAKILMGTIKFCFFLLSIQAMDISKDSKRVLLRIINAVKSSDTDTIASLLKSQVHTADIDSVKLNQLMLYCAIKKNDSKVVEFLLKKNAALIESKDKDGATPLHLAACYGDENIIKLILSAGIAINSTDNQLSTPLHYAAANNNISGVKILIQEGASVESTDSEGITPLHVASLAGNRETAEYLLDEGANIESKNNEGYTPLHYAAIEPHIVLIKFLLSRGADSRSTTNNGDTLLALVSTNSRITQQQFQDIQDLLIKRDTH